MQPGFHCRFANTERFRSLGHVEVLHVTQNEDLAVDVAPKAVRKWFSSREASPPSILRSSTS